MDVIEKFAKKNKLYAPKFCIKKETSNYYSVRWSETPECEVGLPILIKETNGHCEVVDGKEVFDILEEVNPIWTIDQNKGIKTFIQCTTFLHVVILSMAKPPVLWKKKLVCSA